MQIDAETGPFQLARLLTEALALADTLGLSMAAIHIDEAIGQIAALSLIPNDDMLVVIA